MIAWQLQGEIVPFIGANNQKRVVINAALVSKNKVQGLNGFCIQTITYVESTQ